MMFGNRVRIDDELYEKVKKCAEAGGYSSPEEFVTHVLEKEIARLLDFSDPDSTSAEEIKKRLQGLGYID